MATELYGHETNVAKLKKIMGDRKHYSQSCFLFVGPAGSGKRQAAKWFAENVSHPMDVTEFAYDGQQTQFEFADVFYSMNYGARKNSVKTYIIDLQKPLTPIISNALLKSLEEVKPNTCIILVVPDESYLLATISSRARTFEFDALSPGVCDWILENKLGFTPEQRVVVRQCFGTNLELASSMTYDEIVESRDYVYEQVSGMETPFHFIEVFQLAYYMAQPYYFNAYRAILLNWAAGYIMEPEWAQRFSELAKNLLRINANEQNLDLWIHRAFIKYLGWPLPAVITPYETIE